MPDTLLSLRKSRHIFQEGVVRYKKLQKKLLPHDLKNFEELLDTLSSALEKKAKQEASQTALRLNDFLKTTGKKSVLEHFSEFFFAICFAILVAACVRQMWFELYEIPTGSMRPTFREHDRVLVSKTSFGINTPFQTKHLNFDPKLLKRGNIIVITGDGLDLPDVDTTYFLLFPGKKRYVKRCMGLPGDTLYFYGGKIFGVDKEGQAIENYANDPSFASIEHIPFNTFEGYKSYHNFDPETGMSEIVIMHMNKPCAKVYANAKGVLVSELNTPSGWVRQAPNALYFANLWGMRNFAEARLITPEELPKEAETRGYTHKEALLYLELRHTPTLPVGTAPSYENEKYISLSPLQTRITWLALKKEHLETLAKSLYTSRFVVENGKAYSYSHDQKYARGISLVKEIPNGTYEFFDGIAYKMNMFDMPIELERSHPIYPHTPQDLKTFFNSGIDFFEHNLPKSSSRSTKQMGSFPSRYAYFCDASFFAMGKELIAKEDPVLTNFIEKEKERERYIPGYIAFLDQGSPKNQDETLDVEKIRAQGLALPQDSYLALGDNYANSLDSRYFGFVPENNIQGAPILIFWPLGSRFGLPSQPDIPFLRLQNLYVLTPIIILLVVAVWHHRKRTSFQEYKQLKTLK